jgi:acyl-CoA thioester hydrolase
VGEPYRCPVRVRYGECDAQGVVFNAHYLAYCDLALTELWRAAVGSYQAMVERGVDIVVAEAHLRFRSPARFDDELTLEIAMGELGTTNLPSRHRILRGEELLVEVAMRHVMVDTATLTKTPIPDWLRDALARYSVELS